MCFRTSLLGNCRLLAALFWLFSLTACQEEGLHGTNNCQAVYAHKVALADSAFPVGTVLMAKQYGPYTGIMEINRKGVSVYGADGAFVNYFGPEKADDIPFPDIRTDGFSISGDTVHLLYGFRNEVLSYLMNGTFLFKTGLSFPHEGPQVFWGGQSPVFEELPPLGSYAIALQHPPEGGKTGHRFDQEGIIGVFDGQGALRFSFGAYPDAYRQGSFKKWAKLFNAVTDQGLCYFLPMHGTTSVQVFGLEEGRPTVEFPLPDPGFDPQIRYGENSPGAPDNDVWEQLLVRNGLLAAAYSVYQAQGTGKGQRKALLMDTKNKRALAAPVPNGLFILDILEGQKLYVLLTQNEEEGLFLAELSFGCGD